MTELIKGMVQVDKTTYRIEKISTFNYQVIRIIDDIVIGKFKTSPKIEITEGEDWNMMKLIICQTIRLGKTSWISKL